jgi:hypothetical protein
VIEEGKLKVYSENYVKFYNIAGDIIIEVNQNYHKQNYY